MNVFELNSQVVFHYKLKTNAKTCLEIYNGLRIERFEKWMVFLSLTVFGEFIDLKIECGGRSEGIHEQSPFSSL